jgi:hypothetical protein
VATGDLVACSGAGNAAAVPGGEILTINSGDGDAFLDNCESARLGFTVANTGATQATNVRIISVASPSHPSTLFATPTWTAASISACTSDPTAFIEITQAAGLSHGDSFEVDVEITNDEIAPLTRTTTFTIDDTETDWVLVPLMTYDFETDLEGWTVQSGTFVRDDTTSPPGGTSYLQSSSDLGDQCDVIRSPEIVLTETSTVNLWTRYNIEGGTPWYDRANVRIIDSGSETVIEPDGGRSYDVPSGSSNGSCGTTNQSGWAGSNTAWASSAFSTSALDSTSLDGHEVSFEIHYGTDSSVHYEGFAFDLFEITDVMEKRPDTHSDSCGSGLIFTDGFESGNTSNWSN